MLFSSSLVALVSAGANADLLSHPVLGEGIPVKLSAIVKSPTFTALGLASQLARRALKSTSSGGAPSPNRPPAPALVRPGCAKDTATAPLTIAEASAGTGAGTLALAQPQDDAALHGVLIDVFAVCFA